MGTYIEHKQPRYYALVSVKVDRTIAQFAIFPWRATVRFGAVAPGVPSPIGEDYVVDREFETFEEAVKWVLTVPSHLVFGWRDGRYGEPVSNMDWQFQ